MMPLASKMNPTPPKEKPQVAFHPGFTWFCFKAVFQRHSLIQDHHFKATFPWHLTIKNRMDLSTKNLKSYRSQEPFHKVSLCCAKLNWSFSRQQAPLRPPHARCLDRITTDPGAGESKLSCQHLWSKYKVPIKGGRYCFWRVNWVRG